MFSKLLYNYFDAVVKKIFSSFISTICGSVKTIFGPKLPHQVKYVKQNIPRMIYESSRMNNAKNTKFVLLIKYENIYRNGSYWPFKQIFTHEMPFGSKIMNIGPINGLFNFEKFFIIYLFIDSAR